MTKEALGGMLMLLPWVTAFAFALKNIGKRVPIDLRVVYAVIGTYVLGRILAEKGLFEVVFGKTIFELLLGGA